MHRHHMSGRSSRPIFRQLRFPTLCDAAFCHNSSGFLAAPYASCNRSGILWRVDCRSIFKTSRHRVSSTTDQRRETSAVVARRSGPSHRPGPRAGRPRRGFVILERPRPRFVEVRRLADGSVAFYFCISKYYRKLGCEIANEPLGTNYESACGEDGKGGRAATLNALFDEWNDRRKGESDQAGKDCALRHHRLAVPTIQDGESLH
jgi:hypothetical protein